MFCSKKAARESMPACTCGACVCLRRHCNCRCNVNAIRCNARLARVQELKWSRETSAAGGE